MIRFYRFSKKRSDQIYFLKKMEQFLRKYVKKLDSKMIFVKTHHKNTECCALQNSTK
jgi:hypothetical protein